MGRKAGAHNSVDCQFAGHSLGDMAAGYSVVVDKVLDRQPAADRVAERLPASDPDWDCLLRAYLEEFDRLIDPPLLEEDRRLAAIRRDWTAELRV